MLTATQNLDSSAGELKFFDNLKGLLTPQEVEQLLGVSRATIYDWKYRSVMREVPNGLFVKFNRKLFIRTDILRKWILSQNR
jgi:hypothetical protein